VQTAPRIAVIAAALAVGLAGCKTPEPDLPRSPAITLPAAIRVGTSRGIVRVPFEEYVLGSILAEAGPVGEPPDVVGRVFEVQAILARTYALVHLGRHRAEGFDLCDATHCQVYDPARIGRSRFSTEAARAVVRTEGVVLSFAGRPIDALYHSDCGGHTAAASDVWGGAPVPYLIGAPDDVPGASHRAWQLDVAPARLRAILNADPRSAVGGRLDTLAVAARDASGRAARIALDGERTLTIGGEALRAIVNQALGPRAVMSTRFTLTRAASGYHFQGTGFGHGVGLCQVGAQARARRGDAPAQILAAYFPGVVLTTARTGGAGRPALPLAAGAPPDTMP
jgi:stage II sporulation protein D